MKIHKLIGSFESRYYANVYSPKFPANKDHHNSIYLSGLHRVDTLREQKILKWDVLDIGTYCMLDNGSMTKGSISDTEAGSQVFVMSTNCGLVNCSVAPLYKIIEFLPPLVFRCTR